MFPPGGAMMVDGVPAPPPGPPAVDGVPAPAADDGGVPWGGHELAVRLRAGDWTIIKAAAETCGVSVDEIMRLGAVQYAHNLLVGVVCESG